MKKNDKSSAVGSAAVCLKPGCGREAAVRGLCHNCYTVARKLVREGLLSWEALEESGKCLPAKRQQSKTKEWLLEK